ncbi:MAG: hypothetical protein ACKOCN_12375, partial [Planctomycetaceae bacterium]
PSRMFDSVSFPRPRRDVIAAESEAWRLSNMPSFPMFSRGLHPLRTTDPFQGSPADGGLFKGPLGSCDNAVL